MLPKDRGIPGTSMTKLAVSRGHCDYPSLRGAPGRPPWDARPVLEGTLSGDTYTTTAKYVWEGNSYYSPLLYSMLSGTWRYHLYDGLGSTRQLMLHTDQSITDTYQYEAFGNLTGSTGTTPNPYRYVGSLGYYQTGSSLMQLGARYYMPEVGGFTGPDPLLRMRAYSYCGDRPTFYVDPAGLASINDPGQRGPISDIIGWLRDRCIQSELCQMFNPENWSNEADCKAQCYNDCVISILGLGVLGAAGGAGGAVAEGGLAGLGGYAIPALPGLAALAVGTMAYCANKCGYGK
jgi:RHS repeat-associated protein